MLHRLCRCPFFLCCAGVWLSPWGGYSYARGQRMIYGHRNGFETNKNGFSLAGPKYFKRFLETCSEFISVHGARFFKFDGTHARTHACNDNCTACHGWTRVWIVARSRWTLTGLVLLLLPPPTPPTPVTGGPAQPSINVGGKQAAFIHADVRTFQRDALLSQKVSPVGL